MSWLSFAARQPTYSPLGGDKKLQPVKQKPIWIIVSLCVFSFFGGTQLHHLTKPVNPLQFPGEMQPFEYNRSFTLRPSEQTNNAWHSLLPQHGGYFRHPQLAPSRSAFAVFHQLHCLDSIRTGYWAALDATLAGERMEEKDFSFIASPPHIRHCIDLIRQALMCQPDLTIEVKDEVKGGVTGFGVEHQCVRWDSLLSWVKEWESYGREV